MRFWPNAWHGRALRIRRRRRYKCGGENRDCHQHNARAHEVRSHTRRRTSMPQGFTARVTALVATCCQRARRGRVPRLVDHERVDHPHPYIIRIRHLRRRESIWLCPAGSAALQPMLMREPTRPDRAL